jgi:uncharacterized membrane protein YdbT with pleckstrin-like domain
MLDKEKIYSYNEAIREIYFLLSKFGGSFMNYVEKNLRKGEQEVVRAKISIWWLMPKIVQLAVCVVIAALISFLLVPKIGVEGDAGETIALVLNLLGWAGVVVLFGVLPLIMRFVVIKTTYLTVTNKRVVGKQGILKVQTLDIPVDKVDNVSFRAGMWGNIFHYYTLAIKSVGSEGWEFRALSNAQKFKDSVNDAIEKHAEEARKAQAEQIALAMNGGKNN